jgi:hypothetical protein
MEDKMLFKYENTKLNEYRKNGIFKVLKMYILFLPFMFLYMSFIYNDYENKLLLYVLSLIIVTISIGIGIVIGYKKAKNEFESYELNVNNEKIIIKSKMQKKDILIKNITKIYKDKNNNIYIKSGISKTIIFNFIENIDEFEKYLNNIYKIENYNPIFTIFDYLPIIFYILFMVIAKIGNLELYIIFGILVIIITIYSAIKIIFQQFKLFYKIIGLFAYGYILYGVINGVYYVFKYIQNIK